MITPQQATRLNTQLDIAYELIERTEHELRFAIGKDHTLRIADHEAVADADELLAAQRLLRKVCDRLSALETVQ